MAEILVKNQVCVSCGSEARPQALFCYHCGGSLQSVDFQNSEEEAKPSDVWFRSDISDTTKNSENVEIQEKIATEQIGEDVEKEALKTKVESNESSIVEEISAVPEEIVEDKKEEVKHSVVGNEVHDTSISKPLEKKEKTSKDTKLRSASALRKRTKPTRIKKVEIVWEERDSAPNAWFIIFAMLVSLIAATIIIFAYYLK